MIANLKKKLLLFPLFLLLSCSQNQKPTIAFYYWKTVFKTSTFEKKILADSKVSKIYVRYFDVDVSPNDEAFYPKAAINFESQTKSFDIVPVVYLKNKIFLKKNCDVIDLANKVSDYINQINAKNQIITTEIQLDCDWTVTSQKNYFAFIAAFKKIRKEKLSATIRLHQIKYAKITKIPNVDKGVLMYYNMGSIAADAPNSIYDKINADKYMGSIKNYPLKINVALPIFSWAIHIQNHKVLGLKPKINLKTLTQNHNFKKINANIFLSKKNQYWAGTFYLKNDMLKIEAVSGENLLEMANDLSENCKQQPEEIIFYDLDEFNIKQYENNIFKKISSLF